MKFKTNQLIMNSAIQIVSKIASGKTVLKTQNSVLLTSRDNKIYITACDGKNKIETFIDAKIETEGSVLLPYSFLSDLIKKMPVSEIAFQLDEKNNMVISSGKSKYKMMAYQTEEYQLIDMDEEEISVDVDASLLNQSIDQVKFAVSRDENRQILTGILFEWKSGHLRLVAIDGYRMASRTLNMDTNIEKNIVITEKALLEVQKLILSESAEKINIKASSKMVRFEIGNTVLISSLLNGDFINYENIIPKDYKSEIIINKDEFEDAVDRSTVVIASNQNKVIKMRISDELLLITTDSESGDAHEEIQIHLEGEDQYIGFNPKFILDAIKVTEGEELKIKFTGAKGPCVMSSTENDDYFCLLLPCTI